MKLRLVVLTIPLAGPGGEPVDLWRTLVSHGVADLAPMSVDDEARTLTATLPVAGFRPRTVVVREGKRGARVDVLGPKLSARGEERLRSVLRRVLNLDEDLSAFYSVALADPDLAWAAQGAGRMLRSPTVFEEVVKTICTTNCAWSATVRMTTALVEHLGDPSAGAHGRAFPRPEAMAEAHEDFYRDVVRAGYRGPYLKSIASAVAAAELDLEQLHDPGPFRRGRSRAPARASRRRPVRGRPRDDAARALLDPGARLVDAAQVRQSHGEEEGRGLHHHPPLPRVRAVRGPGLLALSDARLGSRSRRGSTRPPERGRTALGRCQEFVRKPREGLVRRAAGYFPSMRRKSLILVGLAISPAAALAAPSPTSVSIAAEPMVVTYGSEIKLSGMVTPAKAVKVQVSSQPCMKPQARQEPLR